MEMDIVSFGFVERVIVDEDGVKIYFRFVEGIWYLFQNVFSWLVRWRIVRDVVKVFDDVLKFEIFEVRNFMRYYLEED